MPCVRGMMNFRFQIMLKKLHESPLGNIILIAHDGKLVYCNWEEEDCLRKLTKFEKRGMENHSTPKDEETVKETITQLDEYFAGGRKAFYLELEINGTDFQEKVWRNLQNIPYGTKISYKELAKICGNERGTRAVAQACGSNPLALIIPCHRVVAANSFGGYTGGLEKKLWLLKHEADTSFNNKFT